MPLLSTRIFPNFESAMLTVAVPPAAGAAVAGVGADAVTGLVVADAAVVDVGAFVAGLAVLELLEHAANAIAASAAAATNRRLEERIDEPLSIGFPSDYGARGPSVHR